MAFKRNFKILKKNSYTYNLRRGILIDWSIIVILSIHLVMVAVSFMKTRLVIYVVDFRGENEWCWINWTSFNPFHRSSNTNRNFYTVRTKVPLYVHRFNAQILDVNTSVESILKNTDTVNIVFHRGTFTKTDVTVCVVTVNVLNSKA